MRSYPTPSGSGWPGGGDGIGPDAEERALAGQSGTPASGRGAEDRDAALVQVVLDEMSPSDQEILRLAFGLGLGAAAIAVNMGTSIRRAQADLQAATSRFEARSIAVAITSRARVNCDVLAALIPDASAEHAGLADRHCKLVADHRTSCAVCSDAVAYWNLGSELFGTLAALTIARTTPVSLIALDADRPRRFWEKNPVLVALSVVAVLIIAVAALGVSKLIGGQLPASAGPVSSPAAASPAAASPSPVAHPTKTTKRPSRSPSAATRPVVGQPVTQTTSPAPKSTTSHPPSPKPSPTTPPSPPPSRTLPPPPSSPPPSPSPAAS